MGAWLVIRVLACLYRDAISLHLRRATEKKLAPNHEKEEVDKKKKIKF
jgi:hypothetical protein